MCLTADPCHSYWDTNGVFHDTQECEKYCCGDCRTKYCCSDIKYSLTEKKQELCFRRCALHFSLFSPQCSRNEYKLQLFLLYLQVCSSEKKLSCRVCGNRGSCSYSHMHGSHNLLCDSLLLLLQDIQKEKSQSRNDQ